MCNNLIAISFYKQNPLWGSLNMNYSVVGEASVLSSILKIKKTPVTLKRWQHVGIDSGPTTDGLISLIMHCIT